MLEGARMVSTSTEVALQASAAAAAKAATATTAKAPLYKEIQVYRRGSPLVSAFWLAEAALKTESRHAGGIPTAMTSPSMRATNSTSTIVDP